MLSYSDNCNVANIIEKVSGRAGGTGGAMIVLQLILPGLDVGRERSDCCRGVLSVSCVP